MNSPLQDALAKAREHSRVIKRTAGKARHAIAQGNVGTADDFVRELTDRCARLDRAHDAIATDSTADEEGAQASDGQELRDYSPEAIRLRDQLAGCVAGYNSRMRR
jgi:hypothetical protein